MFCGNRSSVNCKLGIGIGYFAMKHIPPLTELRYDYGMSCVDEEVGEDGRKLFKGEKICLCGAFIQMLWLFWVISTCIHFFLLFLLLDCSFFFQLIVGFFFSFFLLLLNFCFGFVLSFDALIQNFGCLYLLVFCPDCFIKRPESGLN